MLVDAEDGLGPEDSSKHVIEKDDGGGKEEDFVVSIEGDQGEGGEDVEVCFDAPTEEVNDEC